MEDDHEVLDADKTMVGNEAINDDLDVTGSIEESHIVAVSAPADVTVLVAITNHPEGAPIVDGGASTDSESAVIR